MALLRKYLIAGLLVWLPLAITIWVLLWVLGLLDGIFASVVGGAASLLPQGSGDSLRSLRDMPGLGVLTLAVLLVGTGVFATNVLGQWWLHQWDKVLHRVPIVKSIYSSVKQVSDTLFSSKGNAFREAVLVEYPRQGAWTIAFVTGTPAAEVAPLLGDPAGAHEQCPYVMENLLLRPGQRSADGPDRDPDGLGPPPPRPWRRDLHRPARPRRPGADRLRPRPRRDVQDRRGRAQRVLPEGASARCARARPAPRTPT
jgi:uncharacterized membrane protein